MNNISLTYKGVALTVLGYLLSYTGVPVIAGDLDTFVTVGVSIVGALTTLYGRYRHGDVTPLGVKKA